MLNSKASFDNKSVEKNNETWLRWTSCCGSGQSPCPLVCSPPDRPNVTVTMSRKWPETTKSKENEPSFKREIIRSQKGKASSFDCSRAIKYKKGGISSIRLLNRTTPSCEWWQTELENHNSSIRRIYIFCCGFICKRDAEAPNESQKWSKIPEFSPKWHTLSILFATSILTMLGPAYTSSSLSHMMMFSKDVRFVTSYTRKWGNDAILDIFFVFANEQCKRYEK